MTILIRRQEPSDYEDVQKIFVGPKAIWGTLQLPFPSVEVWRKRLAEPPQGLFSLAACVKENEKAREEVIGTASIHTFPENPRRRHVGQLGMAIRDDWQGKGAGTALVQAIVDLSDKWLNLTRIELEVYQDNEPAIKLYKKFGFEIEGRLINYAYRDSKYVDSYFMARLRQV